MPDYYDYSGRPGFRDGGIVMVPIQTPGGSHTVWTKRVGNSPGRQVLLLHGGPGCTHEEFEGFDSYLPSAGVEYYYYDQLGSYYSDQPDDPDLWDLGRFVDEVEQVRAALGLEDFILLGHSWGGLLAIEYALAHQEHLRGLVIANMMASTPAYHRYAEDVLLPEVDPDALAEIRGLEASGRTEEPRYLELLVEHYYVHHILRMAAADWPEPIQRMFGHVNEAVYRTLWGPSELIGTEKLADWDRTADLHRITVPTLVVGATHDTMDPSHMRAVADAVADGTYLHCAAGSHLVLYDDPAPFVEGLTEFIDRCAGPRTPVFPSRARYLDNAGRQDVLAGGVRLIPIDTPEGAHKVWTKRVGNNDEVKLLLLHGGPGCTHEEFEAFDSHLPPAGIEYYYYDQLGSSYSDQPDSLDLWRLDRFVDEVEQVRVALGLGPENFYLLGHSWGGILAMEYALAYQEHLKGLVISNMMASIPAYNRYAEEVLMPAMDQDALAEIKHLEATGRTDDARYMELLVPNHYEHHVIRMPEASWPDPMRRAFRHLNPDVYVTMQGPSELGASGRLAAWDRTGDLHRITVPTLVIGATHDTMDPEQMRWMAETVKRGTYLHCPNGSHCALYDDQETYVRGLVDFLTA